MGFRYKKSDNRKTLCEQTAVVAKRCHFLRSYMSNKKAEHVLTPVFLDETWIFSKGADKRSWQDDTSKCSKNPNKTSNGKRYIILHAGNKNGFIENMGMVFASTKKSIDYHENMNADLFEDWFENLVRALPEPSLIVLDNAPYHSRRVEALPSTSWRKDAIRQWLLVKGISFDENALKAELLHIAVLNSPEKRHVVDDIAFKHGHRVLRLPPYHCQFNPIELVWGITKTYYDNHIDQSGSSDESVRKVWQEALAKITPEIWSNCIRHAEEVMQKYITHEQILEEVRPLIINVNDDSEDDTNWSDSDENNET